MISGDEVVRLVIYGVTPDDAGAYSISLSNAFGQDSDVVNVNINSKKRTDKPVGDVARDAASFAA